MLGGLNQVWKHIESYEQTGRRFQRTPPECIMEVLRLLGSLTRMDFRQDMNEVVTCSDASTSGGGMCASVATSPFGKMVAKGALRGELAEHRPEHMVLCVGLFDGIGALRVALHGLAWSAGHWACVR